MKRILVTGASGFIGSHSLEPLKNLGYEVHAVSRQRAAGHSGLFWHSAHLLEEGEQERLISYVKPTHLLHFAWYVEHGSYLHAPENRVWLEASTSLFKKFVEHGGQRIAVAGTCAEYDWNSGKDGILVCDEKSTPINPATPYAECKNELHLRLQKMNLPLGYLWGRMFFVYGLGEPKTRLVPKIVSALKSGTPLPLIYSERVRDYLYVKDAGNAFASLIDSNEKGPVNVASGEAHRLVDIVDVISDLIGVTHVLNYPKPQEPDREPKTLIANTDMLQKKLRWSPRYDLQAGLAEVILGH